jgi:hypothetical protein
MPRFCALLIALPLLVNTAGCVVETNRPAREAVVDREPPPDQAETPGNPPSTEHVWIKGHWRHEAARHDYVWVPGHWETRPRPGAQWLHGRWERRGGGWVWVEGRWQLLMESRPASFRCALGHGRGNAGAGMRWGEVPTLKGGTRTPSRN